MNILRALQVFKVARDVREARRLLSSNLVEVNDEPANSETEIRGTDKVQVFKREFFGRVFCLNTKFHYSSYWGRWSRRLSCDSPHGPFVEVNLTPIPNCYDSTWEKDVRPIRIRCHGTSADRGDIDTDELPAKIYEQMILNLGEDLVERLLNEDFLAQIDMSKYSRYCNGGANFEDIKK